MKVLKPHDKIGWITAVDLCLIPSIGFQLRNHLIQQPWRGVVESTFGYQQD